MSQHLLKNNRHTLQNPGFQEVEVHHDLRNLQKTTTKMSGMILKPNIFYLGQKHLKFTFHNKTQDRGSV